ncbi:Homeodomain-like protein [Xylaria bambusicola]|uniref:Homeodomain-like protein n=1 Tax=Xylaria bambusicola TaxID=326684 RepID=UPI00200801CB|nr:Homeodomain-like protein [Xylaria bambusicola]KAI0505632.1 Homeodomain-like protein [Xylaria bambusicola]
MTLKAKRIPKRWSMEEDYILHEETQKQELAGDTKDWHRIAAKLPGRTNKDCRKRWVNKVCGSLKKGPWNKSEDESLLDAVDRYGQRWTLVANDVSFRSPDQCAKRWQSKLDPNLEHGGWTTEEDELLLSLVRENGREWKMFQEQNFSRRSTNELKNRYTGLTRKSKNIFNLGESVSLSPSSGSFNMDYSTDMEDYGVTESSFGLHSHIGNANGVSMIDPLVQQGLTVDWVNSLDSSCIWRDPLSYSHDSIVEDILLEEFFLPGDCTIRKEETYKPSLITPLNTTPATSGCEQVPGLTSPTSWPDLSFEQEIVTPGAISADPSYTIEPNTLGDDLLASIQTESCEMSFTDEGKASDNILAPIETNVGRVTLVIDGCNRDTLDSLLSLTKSLKGKTKIEIN